MTISLDAPTADLTTYESDLADQLTLSREAQDLLFRSARTANTFTDEPVTDEQVRAIYDLAKWAPTSMNNQPLRIVLVRSPQAREKLAKVLSVNVDDWKQEVLMQEELFLKLYTDLPKELLFQKELLIARL